MEDQLFRLGDHCRYPATRMIIADLYSQRDAVATLLREIESSEKLNWLAERGELIPISMTAPSPPAYRFRASSGIETKFVIRDGLMIFIGEHTTASSVEIGR